MLNYIVDQESLRAFPQLSMFSIELKKLQQFEQGIADPQWCISPQDMSKLVSNSYMSYSLIRRSDPTGIAYFRNISGFIRRQFLHLK